MTIETEHAGLRERKRLATRRAIEMAAVGLISENSLDTVTVDEISHAADISPRTFFNYFPSKEAAIIGDAPEMPDDDSVGRYVDAPIGSSVFDGLAALLGAATGDSAVDGDLMHQRRSLLKQYPELFARRMSAMRTFEDQLREVVAQRLVVDEPDLAEDPATLLSRSRLVTHVAFGAMKHAWSCWSDSESAVPLSERLAESFAELGRILTPHPEAALTPHPDAALTPHPDASESRPIG